MATLHKVGSEHHMERGTSSHLVQPQRSAKTLPAEPKKREKKHSVSHPQPASNSRIWCCGSSSDVRHVPKIKQVEVGRNLEALHED
jgi:hypothetical protein